MRPSPPSNATLATRFLQAHATGDIRTLLALVDPHFELHTTSGVFQGREGAREWAEPRSKALALELHPERTIERGTRLLVEIRMQFRWRKTGVLAADRPAGALFTLRDGKVLRLKVYDDRDAARRALRVSQPNFTSLP